MKPFCISLYYDDTMWHKAICKGIKPFIDNTKDIETYIIRLSHQGGCNIRMIITPCKDSDAFVLANHIDSWFKNFLLKAPSISTKNRLEENRLFLNFQNNTIHYGTFEYIPFSISDDYHNSVFLKYDNNVSKVIFELFACFKEETLENIIEISIQLLFIFVSALKITIIDSLTLFETLLSNEYIKYELEAAESLKMENSSMFNDNKDFIIQSFIENRNNNLKDYEEEWQILWYLTVTDCQKSLTEFENKNISLQELTIMINMLFNSLNLQCRSTVCHFAYSTLKDIYTSAK
jgi:hypothetical protein